MIRAFSDAEALQKAGRRLGVILQAGDAVALEGPLGAGKTTFTQGVCAGLGAAGEVASPTFALMNVYEGRLPVYHLDLYRLDDPARLRQLGYEADLAESGVTLVEWADKHWPFWTDDVLRIRLEYLPDGRRLTAEAGGARAAAVLDLWAKALS